MPPRPVLPRRRNECPAAPRKAARRRQAIVPVRSTRAGAVPFGWRDRGNGRSRPSCRQGSPTGLIANIVDVPLPVNFVREIENLPLPPEAYQCPQCRLDHGALGLEPGSNLDPAGPQLLADSCLTIGYLPNDGLSNHRCTRFVAKDHRPFRYPTAKFVDGTLNALPKWINVVMDDQETAR
jgi:hypothetical protein